ncbi:hypothetical protein [Yersinia ruckeri]|uniref:hypothetical protein n=1 Tax=Yersinia ruckeri TaxID=29486 RepID=UPI0022387150|nr:hypothetical protein [Yersinia ruckeri]MCW6598832.1 hypothetical protein [Yersinia ruckeri]
MNIKSVCLLASIVSFPALSDNSIQLEQYLIPQERYESSSLVTSRQSSIDLKFDKASQVYQETINGQPVGSLTIKSGYNKLTLTQMGKTPLINGISYVDDGFIVEIPKEVPDYYSVMLGRELQMVIYKNFKAITNPKKDLVLTDCISIAFHTIDKQFSATSFCKGIGPSQIMINGRSELILGGWNFDYPAFGTSS